MLQGGVCLFSIASGRDATGHVDKETSFKQASHMKWGENLLDLHFRIDLVVISKKLMYTSSRMQSFWYRLASNNDFGYVLLWLIVESANSDAISMEDKRRRNKSKIFREWNLVFTLE